MKKRSKNWFADAVQKAAEALAQSDGSGMTLEEQIEDDAEYGYFDDAMDYSPPEPIELEPAQIAPALFHGMRYCFLCHRDYDDYCDFYHVDHEIYRARLSDENVSKMKNYYTQTTEFTVIETLF